jgi:hypothetical protein
MKTFFNRERSHSYRSTQRTKRDVPAASRQRLLKRLFVLQSEKYLRGVTKKHKKRSALDLTPSLKVCAFVLVATFTVWRA